MIIGHQKQWQYLKKLAKLDRLPHALLFSGQEKLGKKTFAFEFVKYLNCQEKVKPCQKCRSCQAIQKRQHPDLAIIEVAEPEKKEIQISQIRELIWKISLKPYLSKLKIAIIDPAHCLNQEAQSAFLKTLEEPKANTLLILIDEYPENLLPPLYSRLHQIKFYPVKKTEMRDYLKDQKVSESEREEILEICQGKPGVAIDLITQPQKLKERKELIAEIMRLNQSDLASRFQYLQKISQSHQLKEILNLWIFHFRKNLISNLNSEIEPWKIEKWAKILEKIQETIFLISTTNVNPKLALEVLMLQFP